MSEFMGGCAFFAWAQPCQEIMFQHYGSDTLLWPRFTAMAKLSSGLSVNVDSACRKKSLCRFLPPRHLWPEDCSPTKIVPTDSS